MHLPAEAGLNFTLFLLALLLGFTFYLAFQNKKFALFAVLLCACSIIQAESYSMFLWKTLLALPFLVLGFKFLQEKKWLAFAISTLIILLTHRTTAIIYLLTIGLYFIWQLIKAKRYKWIVGGLTTTGFLIILFLPQLKIIIQNLISNNNYFVRTGLFLPYQNLFSLLWPYLLLAIPGLYLYIKQKEQPLWLILFGVSVLWFIFHLPFYRRILIYLDLSLIVFAAYFLSTVIAKSRLPKAGVMVIVTVIVLFLSYRSATFILAKPPLIYAEETEEIKNFNFPSGFVLAVSANDAPWLLGYINNQRLGAPGLLEDPHTYQEWIEFWNGQNQRQFISHYPRPLYFYQRAYQLPPVGITQCLRPLTINFSEIDFSCIEKTLP